jgi:hypothetical protein
MDYPKSDVDGKVKSATADMGETDELVEMVANMMAHGWHKHALKRQLEQDLGLPIGSISIPLYESLRTRARVLLADNMKLSMPGLYQQFLEVLFEIIRNPKTFAQSKIAAMQEAERILSLSSVGSDSQPERIRNMLKSMESSVAEEDEDGSADADSKME